MKRLFERIAHPWPSPDDVVTVSRMVARQWRGIAARTPTYLAGYRDDPGAETRAQRRAEWIARLWPFRHAKTVLEIGCGAGRNLACLHRAYPGLRLYGTDICPEAVAAARYAGLGVGVWESDLHAPTWPSWFQVDTVLSVGVLVHLHPTIVRDTVLPSLAALARRLVLVEEEGQGELLKGPRPWRPQIKATDDYVMWAPPLRQMLMAIPRVRAITHKDVPADLQSLGARVVLVAECAG